MGFALWIDGGLAFAQGTHEYRPMGVAVIAVTDLFRQRDFDPARKPPAPRRSSSSYTGLFASLGDVNHYLRSHARQKKLRTSNSLTLPII
jgi:hypothetical protein